MVDKRKCKKLHINYEVESEGKHNEKDLKKITAYTLAGAIVAGSFGSYNQVNAKEADTDNIKKTVIESEFALYDKTIDGKEIISDVDDYDTSEDNYVDFQTDYYNPAYKNYQ